MTIRRLLPWCALLAAFGCAPKPKPPLVNLWARHGLAVLPFTGDAALAADVRAEFLAALRAMEATAVAEPAAADRVAARAPAASVSPWTDAGWRSMAAAELGADVLLAGRVWDWKETWTAEKPIRLRSQVDPSWRWGATDSTTAHFRAQLTLVDAVTGAAVWTKTLPADGRNSRWIELPWPSDKTAGPAAGWTELLAQVRPPAPPAGSPRWMSDTSAARARAEAITDLARVALADYAGRDGWVAPARPTAAPH